MTPTAMHAVAVLLMCLVGEFGVKCTPKPVNDLDAARKFLNNYNKRASRIFSRYSKALWTYNTNITDYNQKDKDQKSLEVDKFKQKKAKSASRFNLTLMDDLMRREFIKIMDIGTAAQTDETKLKRLSQIESEMTTIYSTGKACLTPQECLPLTPDLERLFTSSRDYNKLLAAWISWRNATGPKIKNLYVEYVTLSNDAIRLLGHADMGAYWRSWYDIPTFESDVQTLFDQLQPLYEQLHSFVRRRLKAIYGQDKFPSTGHIPAHLLGNMWAQKWDSLMAELTPYSGQSVFNITEAMVKKKYTAKRMFKLADQFFTSLGMIKMPNSFWKNSMIEKPKDGRKALCHPFAQNLMNGDDFRISQCTDINQENFEIVHHEMGHVEYFLQYKDQPINFREGANPGFHEAIGDVIALSVMTQEHMKSLGLLKSVVNNPEAEINFLMNMALKKIAFIPFGFLIDQWRWNVFSGKTKPEQYNEHWWNMRCKYQGVSPAVKRTESDFDPAAKFHVPGNTPYIRYFVSFVIQFQFHKALCDLAGHKGPLHKCDIYKSKAAGAALSNMLKLGSSKPWPEAMKLLTGQTKMDAQPLMDYFKPLVDYLKTENKKDFGWKPECPML